MPAARVLIVAGRKLMREGLTRLLAGEDSIHVCGDADEAAKAMRMILPMDINIVLLILGSDGQSGVDLVRSFTALRPAPGVVVLPINASAALPQRLLQAGARACLTRDCDSQGIIAAIRTVVAGGTYLSPAFSATAQASPANSPSTIASDWAAAGSERLAPREREILHQIASGKSTKEIAFTLGVSVKTIETHRRRIMQKLNRHSIAELTQYAMTEGLIPFPR